MIFPFVMPGLTGHLFACLALWVLLQNRLATLDPSQAALGPLPLTVPRVARVLEHPPTRARRKQTGAKGIEDRRRTFLAEMPGQAGHDRTEGQMESSVRTLMSSGSMGLSILTAFAMGTYTI